MIGKRRVDPMVRQTRRVVELRRTAAPFTNEETQKVVSRVLELTGDEQLSKSIEFSPTAISMIRRLLEKGGTIVPDTDALMSSVRTEALTGTNAEIKCYLELPEVFKLAESRKITRAEVAADLALNREGGKLMVIGTAPAALMRVLCHRQHMPMTDVCVLATVSGFAQAVELKERLRDSGLAYIVTRGRCGGPNAAAAILNSILETISE